jgi:DNA repair exonuclease SbcCD ATPase subunit
MGDLQAEHEVMSKRLRQAENDIETGRKAWEAERAMLIERCANASASAASSRSPVAGKGRGGGYGMSGDGMGGVDDSDRVIEQLEDQVRSLGQQLLKKQEGMQELLSERAGLKVRLQDAQRRWVR